MAIPYLQKYFYGAAYQFLEPIVVVRGPSSGQLVLGRWLVI